MDVSSKSSSNLLSEDTHFRPTNTSRQLTHLVAGGQPCGAHGHHHSARPPRHLRSPRLRLLRQGAPAARPHAARSGRVGGVKRDGELPGRAE